MEQVDSGRVEYRDRDYCDKNGEEITDLGLGVTYRF